MARIGGDGGEPGSAAIGRNAEQIEQGGLMLADGLPQRGRHSAQRIGDQFVALGPKPNPMSASSVKSIGRSFDRTLVE
jgi:hypothetical protein